MTTIDKRQARRIMEEYFKKHPEERNKPPMTREEYIKLMLEKGFHFSEEVIDEYKQKKK